MPILSIPSPVIEINSNIHDANVVALDPTTPGTLKNVTVPVNANVQSTNTSPTLDVSTNWRGGSVIRIKNSATITGGQGLAGPTRDYRVDLVEEKQ